MLVKKCFAKGCTNWMTQDGGYYLDTTNEEFIKTFGAKEPFTAFVTTLFKEKMFAHAIVNDSIHH